MATKTIKMKNKPSAKESKKTKKSKMLPHDKFYFSFEIFFNELSCIREMYTLIMPILHAEDKKRTTKLKKIVRVAKNRKKGNLNITQVKEIINIIKKLSLAKTIFASHSIVMLVSTLEVFLNTVFRCLYLNIPQKIKLEEKMVSLKNIIQLSDFSKIKESVIDDEIIAMFKSTSLIDIILNLDADMKLGLKDHCNCLDNFIEIIERRHLYVHSRGRANRKYLQKVPKSDTHEGAYLQVTDEYFKKVYICLFEIGLRIGDAIFRRIFPKQMDKADTSLNIQVGFPLLENKEWHLANIVFDYALGLPKKYKSTDENYLIFFINKCICLENLKRKKEMLQLLESQDWSSSSREFKLAVEVLKENYKKAEYIMSQMTKKQISDENFRTWPLFNTFRKTEYFQRSYKKLFGKKYSPKILDIIKDSK